MALLTEFGGKGDFFFYKQWLTRNQPIFFLLSSSVYCIGSKKTICLDGKEQEQKEENNQNL
jgi:hypothetical protein